MENKHSHPIKLITDITLLKDNTVLLVKYSDTNKYDHQQGWFIPDDLVKDLEDPDESAKRILKEQLSIEGLNPKIAFVESFIGHDKTWHIVFHYKVNLESDIKITISDNIKEMKWFDKTNLPDKKEIAHHGWAVYTLNEILKQK